MNHCTHCTIVEQNDDVLLFQSGLSMECEERAKMLVTNWKGWHTAALPPSSENSSWIETTSICRSCDFIFYFFLFFCTANCSSQFPLVYITLGLEMGVVLILFQSSFTGFSSKCSACSFSSSSPAFWYLKTNVLVFK